MGVGETGSGSETGSYLRLIDFVYHATLSLSKKKEEALDLQGARHSEKARARGERRART